jgi:response regulator of citrate/malate metabolism
MTIAYIDKHHLADSLLMQIQKKCAAFEFHKITGYEAAQHFIENEKPDLILLDFRLPESGSLEFMKLLHLNNIRQPIIVFHNCLDLLTRQQAVIYGAAHFINTNAEVEHLPAVLSHYLLK